MQQIDWNKKIEFTKTSNFYGYNIVKVVKLYNDEDEYPVLVIYDVDGKQHSTWVSERGVNPGGSLLIQNTKHKEKRYFNVYTNDLGEEHGSLAEALEYGGGVLSRICLSWDEEGNVELEKV